MASSLADDSNLVLCEEIVRRIVSSPQQRITFAEYMDVALYHPQYGYYATNAVNIGFQGDFFTSPHLGSDFGELLAEQFLEMWKIMGRSQPFTLVEMGAGQGILAADILGYLKQHYPDFFESLEYVIVEKSTALKQQQKQQLSGLPVKWCNLEEIRSGTISGCCFSNELVDALPVHQFMIATGQLQEIYVTTGKKTQEFSRASFEEIRGEPSTSRFVEYFKLVRIELPSSAYPDGYRSEVNLAALDWLSMVADKLERGYVLTIDYGYPASRYYNPCRQQGTLQCYYRHQHHNNPYVNIGRQDLTAHVDFTALEEWGKLCGLDKVGFTQQGLFLMGLGLGERLAALSTIETRSLQKLLQRREALHQLINPLGLGGFGVLIQSKGLTAVESAHPLRSLMPSM